jgi:hypothetical protein
MARLTLEARPLPAALCLTSGPTLKTAQNDSTPQAKRLATVYGKAWIRLSLSIESLMEGNENINGYML